MFGHLFAPLRLSLRSGCEQRRKDPHPKKASQGGAGRQASCKRVRKGLRRRGERGGRELALWPERGVCGELFRAFCFLGWSIVVIMPGRSILLPPTCFPPCKHRYFNPFI